ncbi:NOC4L [Branchiostoma lanceolatum]|uniref:NOC4L protein n=1 Tax=Branchiostoma lanceolatum TaxID=7740 RepID=A0A8J9VCF2_BRALA|nr:NOC4L [Branchiostoma lanceolatum]
MSADDVTSEPRSVAADIKRKTKEVLQSREHVNNITDILETAQSEEDVVTAASLSALQKIFSTLLGRKEVYRGKLKGLEEETADPKKQYSRWLGQCYMDTLDILLNRLSSHDNSDIKELALLALLKLVMAEGKHPTSKSGGDQSNFPLRLFQLIIDKLMSSEADQSAVIGRFQDYFQYDDIRLFTFVSLHKNLRTVTKEFTRNPPDTYLHNAHTLLSQVQMPGEGDELNSLYVAPTDPDAECRPKQLKEQRRAFSNAWLSFLKNKLPTSLYKQVLLTLDQAVIPHMSSPKLLIDFLTQSYNIGGAISLLALNGLFTLIYKHNLDYPDFFKKLYALFEPSVFHVKYTARFFHLADIFLTSTHIPAYLAAAFIKRLSRLSLSAPVSSLQVVLVLISNLLRRHPNCQVLVHRSGGEGLGSDPYDANEPDPAKCKAMDSSLWEVKSLQAHFHPDVSQAAVLLGKPLAPLETDLSQYLELQTSEMFDKDLTSRSDQVPLEFHVPKGLFGPKDKFQDIWATERPNKKQKTVT